MGSYPTVSPIACAPERHRQVYFLLHLLSPRQRRLPVRKHGALWCSDFPPRSQGPERRSGRNIFGDVPAVRIDSTLLPYLCPVAREQGKITRAPRTIRLFVCCLDGLDKQVIVYDDSSCVLAGHNAIALANLDLALWRNSKAGRGASFDGYYCPAVV